MKRLQHSVHVIEENYVNTKITSYKAICNNPQHVLTNLFPHHKNTEHNTRARVHNLKLPTKDERNYIPRMLYTNIY